MIDSLILVVDFVVQGVLVFFVVWYALHDFRWFKSWKDRLYGSFRAGILVSSDGQPSKPSVTHIIPETLVLVAVAVGGSYALGVITNLAIYDLLQPEHERIIKSVQDSYGLPEDNSRYLAPLSRLSRPTGHPDQAARKKSACQEINWITHKPEMEQMILEPIDKQLRISRGALLFSLLFAVVSFIKIFFRFGKRDKLWRSLILCIAASIVYLISIRTWAEAEARYHTFVRLGSQMSFSPSSETEKAESSFKGSSSDSKTISSSIVSSSSWDDDICNKIQ